MTKLVTTLGPKSETDLGMILPHEHVFVDLRTWDTPGYAQADPQDVIRLMAPEIERARQAGLTAIVECSTVGVGRRADIERLLSEATRFPLVIPTGIYREPWIPDWARRASEGELSDWMLAELQGEIEHSGVQAGWIKLSAGDEGLTDCETKILHAAAAAGRFTNAVIGSHSIRGSVVRSQLDIIDALGYDPTRFIWIHTQAEPNFSIHIEMARRGAWLEYDSIGNPEWVSEDTIMHNILRLLDAGFGSQLLLSHDRGWFDPALPHGGIPKPYTYLSQQFLPRLRAEGVDEMTINQLTRENPFRAFSR
jgi:phosphotriesterase-related protein